jgi:hypothetical protein
MFYSKPIVIEMGIVNKENPNTMNFVNLVIIMFKYRYN